MLLAVLGPRSPVTLAQADNPLPPAPPEILEKAAPEGEQAPNKPAPLSQELERSEGVIAPADPHVDPGMVQPAPRMPGTTMPVIPPPGTPGGNPNVRPQ